MTDNTPKKKRRSISKARLYTELLAAVKEHKLNDDSTIAELLDAMKEDIIADVLK